MTANVDLAAQARARLEELLSDLAQNRPPAELRDLGIAVTALSSGLDDLERNAGRVTVHRTVLERWAKVTRALLEPVATGGIDGRLELDADAVVDNGTGEPRVITRRAFYDAAEGILIELEDLLE